MKEINKNEPNVGNIGDIYQQKYKKLIVSACIFAVLSLIVCVVGNYVSIGFLFKPEGLEALGFIILLPIMLIAYCCQLVFSIVSISCACSSLKGNKERKGLSISVVVIESITLLFSLVCLVIMLIFGQN